MPGKTGRVRRKAGTARTAAVIASIHTARRTAETEPSCVSATMPPKCGAATAQKTYTAACSEWVRTPARCAASGVVAEREHPAGRRGPRQHQLGSQRHACGHEDGNRDSQNLAEPHSRKVSGRFMARVWVIQRPVRAR